MLETTVRGAVLRNWETGSYTRKLRSGHPKVMHPIDDNFLLMHVAQGVAIMQTVSRQIDEVKLHSTVHCCGPLIPRRPSSQPPLCSQAPHSSFVETMPPGLRITGSLFCFSDKFRHSLKQQFILEYEEWYTQCNIAARVQFRGGSVMVQGGIPILVYYFEYDFLIDIRRNRELFEKWKCFSLEIIYIIPKNQFLFQCLHFISNCKNISIGSPKRNIKKIAWQIKYILSQSFLIQQIIY